MMKLWKACEEKLPFVTPRCGKTCTTDTSKYPIAHATSEAKGRRDPREAPKFPHPTLVIPSPSCERMLITRKNMLFDVFYYFNHS